MLSTENQSMEVIFKKFLNHIFNHWDEIKTQSHPSSTSMSPSKHISVKVSKTFYKRWWVGEDNKIVPGIVIIVSFLIQPTSKI